MACSTSTSKLSQNEMHLCPMHSTELGVSPFASNRVLQCKGEGRLNSRS
jgi:hypothetical protein